MNTAMRTAMGFTMASLLQFGCTSEPLSEHTASVGILFAALKDCLDTPNGSGQVPAEIDRLVLKWSNEEGKTGTDSIKRGSVTKGFWLVKLPATPKLEIDVYGCDKDKKLVWRGHSGGLSVESQKETKARVFLTPVSALTGAQLACTGGATGNGLLQSGRALAGGAVLVGGDVAVVGGINNWSFASSLGAGGTSVDLFDYRLGTFRKGPELAVARIQPHVHAIGATQILVAGGVTSVVSKVGNCGVPVCLMAPQDLAAATPGVKAEVVDLAGDQTGKAKESKADVGVGALPYSSSIHLGAELLFVGGIKAGQAVAQATRLGNFADLAAGGPGASTAIVLKTARIRPGLLKFPDGTAIVWGGAVSKKVDDLGELLATGATASDKLAVTGDAALLAHLNLTTIGPVTATLAQADDTLTFLVAGGVPVETPFKAVDVPSYLVIVNRTAKTAEIKPIALSAGALKAGLGTTVAQLPGGQVLVAGGLLDTKPVPGVCDKGAECILKDWTVVRLAGPPVETTVTLQVVASGQLAGPRFGMTSLTLPAAALLTGGQSRLTEGDASPDAVLDNAGRIVTVAPDDAAAICGQ